MSTANVKNVTLGAAPAGVVTGVVVGVVDDEDELDDDVTVDATDVVAAVVDAVTALTADEEADATASFRCVNGSRECPVGCAVLAEAETTLTAGAPAAGEGMLAPRAADTGAGEDDFESSSGTTAIATTRTATIGQRCFSRRSATKD
jgi:hypothetical protein